MASVNETCDTPNIKDDELQHIFTSLSGTTVNKAKYLMQLFQLTIQVEGML